MQGSSQVEVDVLKLGLVPVMWQDRHELAALDVQVWQFAWQLRKGKPVGSGSTWKPPAFYVEPNTESPAARCRTEAVENDEPPLSWLILNLKLLGRSEGAVTVIRSTSELNEE